MTTGELVDIVLQHRINSGSSDYLNQNMRRRTNEMAQETGEEIWDEADWDGKLSTTTGSLTVSTDTVDAPSDFGSGFGENGGLFIQVGSEWSKLEPVDSQSLFEMREESRSSTGVPQFYTVATQDTDYNPQIIFDVTADATYSLRFYYDAGPPLLLDRPIALTATAGGAGNVNGTVIYRVVFIGEDSSESEAGSTTSITVSSKQVALSAIPTGSTGCTSRKIYRTENGGSTYKLLTTLSDNTTTTYTDDTLDSNLGAEMTATTTASSLKKIPKQYHRSVVLKGTLAKWARHLGSGEAPELEAAYRAELARMKARRRHGLEDLQRIGGLGIFGMH